MSRMDLPPFFSMQSHCEVKFAEKHIAELAFATERNPQQNQMDCGLVWRTNLSFACLPGK